MKKLFVPTLLVLSLTCLTGCGDNGVYVKNGQPYKQGDAAGISAEVKAEKENSVKTVTQKDTLTMKISASARGQSASGTETIKGSCTIDIDNKSIEGSYSISGSGALKDVLDNTTISFKAKDQEGLFVVYEGQEGSEMYSTVELGEIYEFATYNIYSWNYVAQKDQVSELIDSLSDYSGELNEVTNFVNDFQKNLVMAGDPAVGTFDIGLAKALKVTIEGFTLTVNKMKVSYVDGLIKSSVSGLTMKGKEEGVSISASITSSTTYTYTFR